MASLVCQHHRGPGKQAEWLGLQEQRIYPCELWWLGCASWPKLCARLSWLCLQVFPSKEPNWWWFWLLKWMMDWLSWWLPEQCQNGGWSSHHGCVAGKVRSLTQIWSPIRQLRWWRVWGTRTAACVIAEMMEGNICCEKCSFHWQAHQSCLCSLWSSHSSTCLLCLLLILHLSSFLSFLLVLGSNVQQVCSQTLCYLMNWSPYSLKITVTSPHLVLSGHRINLWWGVPYWPTDCAVKLTMWSSILLTTHAFSHSLTRFSTLNSGLTPNSCSSNLHPHCHCFSSISPVSHFFIHLQSSPTITQWLMQSNLNTNTLSFGLKSWAFRSELKSLTMR